MVDFIRAAPGASPSSPGSVSTNSLSAFGSGTNENMFLIDGTNFTCPRSGEARSELLQSFHDEHRVGRARRTVCFRSSGRPEHGQRDDSEPVGSRDGVFSGAPQTFGGLTLIRTTATGTINHYRPELWGTDHQWRIGGQIEKGEHRLSMIIPTGVRFIDNAGRRFKPSRAIHR